MKKELTSETAMKEWGAKIGQELRGGEFIELIGDVGAGKTTFVKGLAAGMGIVSTVQSPTFTINRVYDAPNGLRLSHYDFYRLSDAGIMREELAEIMSDDKTIIIVEWGDVVADIQPTDKLRLSIASPSETSRTVEVTAYGTRAERIAEVAA